jgi:purine-binding chemotaxis protein CheW
VRAVVSTPPALEALLAELRATFDAGFAERRGADPPPARALLAVRAGGVPLAVPIEELAGFHAAGRIVPLPDGAPGLLGLAGIRGRIVAVHDLAAAVGAGALAGAPRWLLVTGGAEPLALAIDAIEGHLKLPWTESGAGSVIEHAGVRWSVVDVRAIAAAIDRRARGAP